MNINHDKNIVPALRWKRVINYILDGVIPIFVLLILGVLGIGALMPKMSFTGKWFGYVYVGLFLIYFLFFELIFGKTPAKFITRTKVVSEDGFKPTWLQIFLRTCSRLMPFEPCSFLDQDIKKTYGWHDRWSGTVVVDANYPTIDKQSNLKLTVKQKILAFLSLIIFLVLVYASYQKSGI